MTWAIPPENLIQIATSLIRAQVALPQTESDGFQSHEVGLFSELTILGTIDFNQITLTLTKMLHDLFP